MKNKEDVEKRFVCKGDVKECYPSHEPMMKEGVKVDELWSWIQQYADQEVIKVEEKYKDFKDVVNNSYLK